MKLNLNTWQRIMAIQALNRQSGHISTIRKALRLLDVLELNDEERAQVRLQEPSPGQFMWQDLARRFELEINDRELVAFLKRAVEQFGQWPVEHAAEVLDVFQQLGIEEKANDEDL